MAAMLVFVPGVLLARGMAPRRQASVLFSDGTVVEGTILLTPGRDFRLVAIPEEQGTKFGKISTFNLDVVREIIFRPYREFYKRHFKFVGGAKTHFGKPYPIREPKCTVVFNSGEKRSGILHTTVIYLKEKDPDTGMIARNRKIFLKSKQKGEPGDRLSDVVYVKRIKMLDEGEKIEKSLEMEFLSLDPESLDELKAITRETLTSVPVTAGEGGNMKVSSTLGENVFLATRIGDRYVAGWPEEGTKRTELFKAVEEKFLKAVDYYNERKLLGILPFDNGRRVLTLSSLRRQAPDYAYRGMGPGFFEIGPDGKVMEFFRLSVWLWNRDPETGEMVLVDRGSFYREQVAPEGETPPAGVSADLWPVVKKDGKLLIGKEKKEIEK